MIEYYIDGSAKDRTIGAGIVRINEFGFMDKRHIAAEHTNPTPQIAEGFAFEKALEMIKENDIHKNELINVYSDCRHLISSLQFNQHFDFHQSEFFIKQETNDYFLYLRELYKELIARKSKSSIYHCSKSKEARPLIKVFYKEDADNRNYLQDAHSMSRQYIKQEESKVLNVVSKAPSKVEAKINKIDLKAVKKANSWHIVKNNGKTIAVNKRPLIALSEALVQTKAQNQQIKLCAYLENLLKSTNKNQLSNESMISAIKIIDEHKNMFVS